MKFVMLYGPPATGKLTVAKELQNLSGYKLFHNHMLVDLLDSIDNERTDDYYSTQEVILEEIFKYATKRQVNLINTFVYAKGVDDSFMDLVKNTIEASKGEAIFIQLSATRETLLRRVEEDSRKQFNKVSTPENLLKIMNQYDVLSPYHKEDLQIDNTNKSAVEVARIIWDILSK